ncbi:hypothetical protein SADUNF_Sadunf03G0108000 [Salix dunnii]|uniref:RING-type E3 ubiquitin transferase n=1 Tax=Salix dunnii TaxID=1413687 RepID=A0A835KGV6_9ROSI|nr:hypothetical protein SADUNF_Sadunf03G0108000 [Salix dunnii]
MGLPQSPAPSHLYPQELQLKLYQAFIFSIPILFSIILFLLFYLFYLKRRTSSLSSPPHIIQGSSNQATPHDHVSSKEEITNKLPVVLFDEELRTKDSQCCVCLGEFEMKEELLQIPSCKHVFHINCIHHWLYSNSTCPLCRCYVMFPTTKFCTNPPQSSGPVLMPHSSTVGANSQYQPQNITSELQHQQDVGSGSTEQLVIPMEESSSETTQSRDTSRLPDLSISMENGRGSSNGEYVVLHIERHIT